MHHYQHSKNQLNSHINSYDTADFRVSWIKRQWPFLTTSTQKLLDQILAFLNLYQHAKNQFIPSVHFWDTVNFRVSWPDLPLPFLTMPTQKIFDELLIFVNLYRQPKFPIFHLFLLQKQSILESCHQTGHTQFWPCPLQKFSSTF